MKRTRYLRLIAPADWSLASLENNISMSSCKTNPTAPFFCALVTQRWVASPSPMWVPVIVSLKYLYYCTWCNIVQKFGIGKLHVFASLLCSPRLHLLVVIVLNITLGPVAISISLQLKLNFQQPLLRSSVSHNPSEIILSRFAAQETFL